MTVSLTRNKIITHTDSTDTSIVRPSDWNAQNTNWAYLENTINTVAEINVHDYGAVGDGTTDDTTAIQNAFNACPLFGCVVLRPNKVYLITNLNLPVPTGGSSWNYGPRVTCMGGYATLKRKSSGGDTDYLVASDRWRTAGAFNTFGSTPWIFSNIIFDGNSTAKYAVVIKAYGTKFINCIFKGATHTQMLFTRLNQDGVTTGSSSFLSECYWTECRIEAGSSNYGFRTEGELVLDYYSPTDGFFVNNIVVGGQTGVYFANTGGWLIDGNHTYGQTTYNFNFNYLSKHYTVSNNTFDLPAIVRIGNVGYPGQSVFGPGNNFYQNLQVDFKADASTETLVLQGNKFYEEPGGTDALIVHNNNRSTKTIVSQDNFGIATTLHTFGGGVTLGKYIIQNSYDGSGPVPNSQFIVEEVTTTASAPPVPRSGAKLFGVTKAGLVRPAYRGALGKSIIELGRRPVTGKQFTVLPVGNSTTASAQGCTATAVGTGTARTWANTNYFSSLNKISYVTAASANSSAGVWTPQSIIWRGNASGLGGFEVLIQFGINSYQAGCRAFAGIANNYHLGATVDPSDSSNTDMFGIGKDASDTNFQLMTNDNSGAATKTDLGVNFPANTSATDVYELRIFCASQGTTFYWSLERLNTGDFTSGTVSSDLPRTVSGLTPEIYINTGAGSVAVDVCLFGIEVNGN